MMAQIGLVACVGEKKRKATFAHDLYTSPLFVKSKAYVELSCDNWFILSAKYGLVNPNDVIEPYDETLNAKTLAERKDWANKVLHQLLGILKKEDTITILAGNKYREFIEIELKKYVSSIYIPLQGLGIGKQMQWLSKKLPGIRRLNDLDRFYSALLRLERGLGGKRILRDCSGKLSWPNSGVYFFFEEGEMRHAEKVQRVVRVGTHQVSEGSKATLWNRLRNHRGSINGLGNHRGSVFRLHVGAAIASQNSSLCLPSWGKGLKPEENEKALERLVSKHIGAMSVLWLAIGDPAGSGSDRAYIERNSIGLLVEKGEAVDTPSPAWLGLSNPDRRIQLSGLWNLDFLDYTYDPNFLDVLEEYISITIEGKVPPEKSIAPHGWHLEKRLKVQTIQLSLFEDL